MKEPISSRISKRMQKTLRGIARENRGGRVRRMFHLAKIYLQKPFGHKMYNFKMLCREVEEQHVERRKALDNLLKTIQEQMRKDGYKI